jgi:hypothetical protein
MNTAPESLHHLDQVEPFFDLIASELSMGNKEVMGRIVNKDIEGESLPIDRRLFIFRNDTHHADIYAFSKKPSDPKAPFHFRGRILRLDMLDLEEAHKGQPKTRNFQNEPIFGLGYKTPVDMETFFEWGGIGCCGDLPSRQKTAPFLNDLQGSIKRMDLFDKKAFIGSTLLRWSQDKQRGVVETPLRKKVNIVGKDLPKTVKHPKPGAKFRCRILREGEEFRAVDLQMG